MSEAGERVRELLAALVKAALMSDEDERRWTEQARAQAIALRELAAEAAGLTMDGLWTRAVREAESRELCPLERRVSLAMPSACPLRIEEVLDPSFDADKAVLRIRGLAATG